MSLPIGFFGFMFYHTLGFFVLQDIALFAAPAYASAAADRATIQRILPAGVYCGLSRRDARSGWL